MKALILISENGDVVGTFATDSINLTDNIVNALKNYLGEQQITEILFSPNYKDYPEHTFDVSAIGSNGRELIYEFSLTQTTVIL